jgi:Flp pilus assembly protein TadG
MTALVTNWWKSERGAAASELALLLVPLSLLVFGIVHLCLITYASVRLNFATEATARCIVVTSNATAGGITAPPCSGTNADLSYLQAMYAGPTALPTFVSGYPDVTQKCTTAGSYQVQAQVNYVINALFISRTVPLVAKACFPT